MSTTNHRHFILQIAFLLLLGLASCKPAGSKQKTDAITKLAIRYLNENKPDSTYALIGEAYKKRIPPTAWASIYIKQLSGLLPLENLTLVSSNDSLSTYKVNARVSLNGEIVVRPFQLVVGSLDKYGKISSIALLPYAETALKAQKVPTDNKVVNHLDSSINRAVSAYIQTKGNVGISVGVWYKGKSFFYNYGERKNGSKILPDNHTLYDIGSITKTFTSTLLAIAVEKQLLTLETSIAKFLPDSIAGNARLKRITFRQLANHTSGLPRDPDNFGPTITNASQPFGNYEINNLYSFLKNVNPPSANYKYAYSNLAVGLMGILLEKVYHKPYQELIREYITMPLKMNETMCSIDTTKFSNLAQGYNAFYQPVPFYQMQALKSAGIIKSSTFDLISYARAQIFTSNPTLDSALKLTHQVTFNKESNIIGLGWYYLPDNKNVMTHTGGTGGYFSSVCIDMTKQIAVVVLTNNASTGHDIGKDLINIIN